MNFKKTLKNILDGLVISGANIMFYTITIIIFIKTYSQIGYNAILLFFGGIIMLANSIILSWFIGYSSEHTPPLIKNGGEQR